MRPQLGSIFVERVGPTYEEAGCEALSSCQSHDPVPVNEENSPFMMELLHDYRGFCYIARWAKPVLFDDGERKTSRWFSVGSCGSEPAA